MKKWLKRVVYFLLFLFVFINIIAAFHAYKFTHFYDDNSQHTPRPEEMNVWERTKVIITGVNYSKRPITDLPAGNYEDVLLSTPDEILLKGWYVPTTSPQGTVVMFHGHGGTRSGTVAEANAFQQMGYNVLAIDFRAHGSSGGNTCTIGYHESADVKTAYDYVKRKGETNIVLWGTSMGAAAIAKAVDEFEDVNPSRIILEMPFGALTDAVEARLTMMNLPRQPLASLLTFWGGVERGFWAFNHKPTEYVRSIQVPVLLQWGRNDSRVSLGETNTIFENIAANDKRLVVYENSGHESLLKKEPAKWLTSVAAFMEAGR